MQNIDVSKVVIEAVIKKLVEKALESFKSVSRPKALATSKVENEFEKKIQNHFNELYTWSSEIEFIGLAKPIETKAKTIELKYYFSKTRYSIDSAKEIYSENDILCSETNAILEGDAGCGKSTTLKRILSTNFLNQDYQVAFLNYPILIRLRALEANDNVFTYICNLLGIPYETEIEYMQVDVPVGPKEEYFRMELSKKSKKSEGKTSATKHLIPQEKKKVLKYVKETRTKLIHTIDGKSIENAVIDFLESNKVLLVFDGLDELRPELFPAIEQQIHDLSFKIRMAKIIITSRPNYIKAQYPNFSYYRIRELTEEQMKIISDKWLPNSQYFLNQLKTKSYFELANRPLFLSFLILLFKNSDSTSDNLPKYSKDVYKQIIELLINKWDKERKVYRSSIYSYFDNNKKLEFLSHLAFHLTYKIKQKIFTRDDLIAGYLTIYKIFDLPEDQADQVAEEVESHTGIIVKSLHNKYEFSHLAIQEFLCANYIISAPFDDEIRLYLREYPSPLAVAVSLSSNPTKWLYELVFKIGINQIPDPELTKICTIILDRIYIESPPFIGEPKLAISIMNLARFADCRDTDFVNSFIRFYDENKTARSAITELSLHYVASFNQNKPEAVLLTKRFGDSAEYYPDTLCLPRVLVLRDNMSHQY
jgi:hypothetical protein